MTTTFADVVVRRTTTGELPNEHAMGDRYSRETMARWKLAVLATTYPRWPHDTVPGFIRDYAQRMAPHFDATTVVVPHYVGAATRESVIPSLTVRRYRYFVPARAQDIVYEGHAAHKVGKNPAYVAKVTLLVIASFFSAGWVAARRGTVINAHWIIPQGAVAVALGFLLRRPVVVTVHGGDVFTLNGPILRRVKRHVLKRADAVVVNSSATLEACVEIHPHRAYEVIPMGVDTTRFAATHRTASNGDFDVLFVGRLSHEKGVFHLLEAVQVLANRGQAGFRVDIVGDGPERATLELLVREHGLRDYVTFHGWVDHAVLAEHYGKADVFVGPSIEGDNGWKEAFCLTIAEASASGLPVIATRTGGIADIVLDGVTGYLVAQRSGVEIADRIVALMQDRTLAQTMGSAGTEHVRAHFSWESVGERYLALLNGVAVRHFG
jgi:glycosyltransferase involved in cell wall biosynthesis